MGVMGEGGVVVVVVVASAGALLDIRRRASGTSTVRSMVLPCSQKRGTQGGEWGDMVWQYSSGAVVMNSVWELGGGELGNWSGKIGRVLLRKFGTGTWGGKMENLV